MNGAFYIGATALDAHQRALDIVAQNVANLNTVGFKRSAIRFSEMVQAPANGSDAALIDNIVRFGPEGLRLEDASRIWAQGDLKSTGNPLDLAIDGEGFIELMGSGGRSLLWRGGTLKVNEDGFLASSDGTALRAMISVPQGTSSIRIDRDGVVSAVTDADGGERQIGRLDMVMVKDKDALGEVGNGLYEATDAANVYSVDPEQEGAGAFVQGSLEQANVDLAQEMVTMLLLQRSFGASAQLVQAGDQLMSIVNNLRR